MALTAVGGDDEQEEEGRSQHHLVKGGSLSFTAPVLGGSLASFNCCLGGNTHTVELEVGQ